MYTIEFYENAHGKSELWDLLELLRTKIKTSKDARIQYNQTVLYIQLLQDNCTRLIVLNTGVFTCFDSKRSHSSDLPCAFS